jgi:AcrR family transcriptional regulator
MPKKSPNPRDRIIAGASARFLAQGFSRVTMDRLAADLGVSKKTLYRHFESKEQLLYAVVTGFLEETAAGVQAILGRKGEEIPSRLASLMDFLSRRLSGVSLVFFDELERLAPDMWQEVQEFRRRKIVENFLKLYRSGRRRIFSPTPDPALTTQLFLALVQGVMNPHSLSRLNFPPAQVMRAVINIFLYGTLSEGYRKKRRIKPREDET